MSGMETIGHDALLLRARSQSTARGELTLLADAGRVEECTQVCLAVFSTFGVKFSEDETDHLRNVLREQIESATVAGQSQITVTYEVPTGFSVDYRVLDHAHGNLPARGEITMPAVPALFDAYAQRCVETFGALGVSFTADEVDTLRGILLEQMTGAFAESSRAHLTVTYEVPSAGRVHYGVKGSWTTIEGTYDSWVETRTPPLFGTEPDARIWNLAAHTDDPEGFFILDIGAGTGRNSLALARKGHPVDAVEMSQQFATIIYDTAQVEQLSNLRVIPTDIDAAGDYLHDAYHLILLSEVVSDFRTVEQLRAVFELSAQRLAPDGALVFNAFLPRDGREVSEAAREYGQHGYTSIFTREEIESAAAGLPMELVSEESVFDYERTHLPAEAWPPTKWYENWTRGLDVFSVADPADSPIDMRWLVYRRRG